MLQPDRPDSRDYLFVAQASSLPSSVDLRRYAGGVEHQGTTNSCTANAGVSACEIWAERAGDPQNFSRLFLYYNEREGYPELAGKDGGAYTRDICKALNKHGVCLESTWPFNPATVNVKPPDGCYDEAKRWKVGRYERVQNRVDLIQSAIARGFPVLVGMSVREAFYRLDFLNYLSSPINGGHAVLIVGYDDNRQSWVIENSWGPSWGDGGYCYFPYQFGSDFHDLWVFTEFGGYVMDEQQAQIGRLYNAVFGRSPDDAGLNYWTDKLKSGMPLRDIASGFMTSQEFQNKYGSVSDDQFVSLLYNNVLKRDPDPVGKQHWQFRLNPPPRIERVDVLISFSESAENKS